TGELSPQLRFLNLLAHLAPIPPLAPFDRKIWVLCLRDGRDEYIQTARIDYRSPDLAKLSIHSLRISPAQLRHATDSEQLEIFEHRRTDGHQIFELTSFGLHISTSISAVALAVA